VILGPAVEAPTVVAGFDDVAVVSEAIQQRGRHFGVGEDAGPFAEGQIGGDDDRGTLIKPIDEVEQELAAGLGEGQITELIENDEVHAGQVIGNPALSTIAGLGLEPVDEIDDVVEAAPGAGSDTASGNRDGKMRLSRAGASDQDSVALLDEEAAAGEIMHQRLVDRGTVELEVFKVLGEWQLGDGKLVLDGVRLLLVDLGGEQVADVALRFVLAFDRGRHDLVEGSLHSVELKLAHEVEELGSFHQAVLLRLL